MAVINAIYQACGVRIYDLPALPEKVKEGLDAVAAGKEIKPERYYLGGDLYEELDEMTSNPVGYVGGGINL